ncbi:hypothetical protein NQ314_006925, partial [Rhamnusium bicolor]
LLSLYSFMMIKTIGFFDLCIPETCFSPGKLEQTVKTLYDFGYRTIAINQLIEEGNMEPKKRRRKVSHESSRI